VISNRQGAITRRNEDPLVQVGGGVLIDLFENSSGSLLFQLRPEIKGRLDFFDRDGVDDFFDAFASIGFTLAFGAGERAAPAAAPPPPAPAPPPAPLAAPAPPPPPPPPFPPPADTDGDGVLDTADRCLDTPRGTAVDATGCTRRGSITLQGVNFETNSATLTADSRPVLDAVAADLKQYARLKIEVQGHTDNVGADAYNLGLLQRRATSVREYLVTQGVGADQLSAKGYGEPSRSRTTPRRQAARRIAAWCWRCWTKRVLETPAKAGPRTVRHETRNPIYVQKFIYRVRRPAFFFVCLFISLCSCLSVCLSVYLSVYFYFIPKMTSRAPARLSPHFSEMRAR
jgi:outer membrane protein OmpA-like peptidoglycan-associated protein